MAIKDIIDLTNSLSSISLGEPVVDTLQSLRETEALLRPRVDAATAACIKNAGETARLEGESGKGPLAVGAAEASRQAGLLLDIDREQTKKDYNRVKDLLEKYEKEQAEKQGPGVASPQGQKNEGERPGSGGVGPGEPRGGRESSGGPANDAAGDRASRTV